MSAATFTPVDEYLRTTSKPACEYLDGVVRQKSMPTKLHSLLQLLLVSALTGQGWDAIHEVLVRVSETRFLVPDVIADRHVESPYATHPVTLCVEILSPGDRFSEAMAKCEDYHAWGVPYCWVLDPVREIAWEYHHGIGLREVDAAGSLTAGEIEVVLAELFDEARRRL